MLDHERLPKFIALTRHSLSEKIALARIVPFRRDGVRLPSTVEHAVARASDVGLGSVGETDERFVTVDRPRDQFTR